MNQRLKRWLICRGRREGAIGGGAGVQGEQRPSKDSGPYSSDASSPSVRGRGQCSMSPPCAPKEGAQQSITPVRMWGNSKWNVNLMTEGHCVPSMTGPHGRGGKERQCPESWWVPATGQNPVGPGTAHTLCSVGSLFLPHV